MTIDEMYVKELENKYKLLSHKIYQCLEVFIQLDAEEISGLKGIITELEELINNEGIKE